MKSKYMWKLELPAALDHYIQKKAPTNKTAEGFMPYLSPSARNKLYVMLD